MKVDYSQLSNANQQLVLSWGSDFGKALMRFAKDNPIGLSRGMDWHGRTVRGNVNGDNIVITSVT